MKTLDEVKRLVGALPDGELPLALLPVQLQTRFVTRGGRPQLLVRVYPDELHLDGHEPGLSAAEAEWGRAYWRLIWPAARDEATQSRAWERLAERFGARRAAWIRRRLTPTNPRERPGRPPVFPRLGPARDDTKERPVRARLLPDRWVVIGYRGGERVLLEVGAPIPATLPVSPAPDAPETPPVDPERLPIDPGMRWLVEFAEAERVGMGIRIELPPAAAPPRFDALVVFGVRAGLTPQAGAGLLEAQLDVHHFTRGLAFVGPGTPTNNTAEASSGFTRRELSPAASFQVEVRAPRPAPSSDGALAARLLGIRRDVFAGVDGAGGTEDLDARRLQTALWPVTGGYYLEQIVAAAGEQQPLAREELDAARRHFVDFVRQLGPLPTLRVGRQPYGLLPVMSLDLLGGGDRFIETLRVLRASWRSALGRVPRLAPGQDGADGLIEILRMQPSSTGYRARLAFPRQFFSPTGVLDGELEPDLREHSVLLRNRLRQLAAERLIPEPRVLDLIPAQTSARLDAPLVQPGGELPGAMLALDYLAFIRAASFDDLLAERLPEGFPPATELRALLYLLLRHSLLLAYGSTAHRILVRRGALPDAPHREPALVDIVGGVRPVRTRTLPRLLDLDPALRAGIHALGAAQEPEAAELDELRASLDHLRTRPVDVLARHLAGCLDLFAYRLDAWITSLATRRLSQQRRRTARGIGIGGFGWVLDLGPEPRTPVVSPPPREGGQPLFAARERGGAIHAPSMAQASAAAVLRSGYLAQAGESETRPFAIDLASERVRLAQWLLEGIREGQPLGSLLGYRFERRLHERGLDRFIAGFRRVSCLAAVYGAQELVREAQLLPEGLLKVRRLRAALAALQRALEDARERHELPATAPVEAIEELAAAKVADGLALARLHEAGGVPFERVAPDAPASRPVLEFELAALHGAVDALSDALTAEGVYQLVRGNPSRAAASVDAIAHGEIQPPELTFAETPRSGTALTHRLVVLLTGATAPPSTELRHARRSAEPALDGWLRQMLGELARARCRAELLDANGAVLFARDLGLGALGISHLDALYLAAVAAPGQPSDLERLLEHHVRRLAPATVPAEARFRLTYERAPNVGPTQLGLGEFLEVLGAFRDTILAARAVDGRDLAPADRQPPPGVDAAQFRARADGAAAALRRARERLAEQRARVAARADPARQVEVLDVLRERLLDLVFFGLSEALPLSARGGDAGARDVLLHQAEVAEQETARRLERLAALEQGFARASAPPDERVRHDLERLRAVFGPQFRALPLVRPANAAELGAAVAASTAAQGGDPLQALSWLQGVARVRPAASRVLAAMSYAAALLRPSALQLRVAQLPSRPGERWVALPAPPGGAFPPGRLSLVAHLPQPFRPAQPFSGLLIDEWVEAVPAPELTTGVGFNYDAPGTRPPQTILLASAPPGAARWEVETLEQTLLETLELAQLRALDPQALGDDVLLQRALPALYVSLNLAGDALSTDFSRLVG